jgi:outer membrane lipoprotein-sorting protein
MSTSSQVPSPDDPIDRAADAMRRTPLPEGPSEQTITRTLDALLAAAGAPDVIPFRRRRIMLTALKAAGVALATAGGLFYFAGFPPASATAEFTEAARKLQDAHTLSVRIISRIAGQPDPLTGRVFYRVPGLIRSETEPAGGPVTIMDVVRGKALALDPAQKSALLLEGRPPQERGINRDLAASMIDDLRRLGEKNGEPAGEKVIGEVRARGFRVKEQGQEMTVWVDPQKRLPLLIEIVGRIGTVDVRSTLADIQLDQRLDDALFSLDPPAGYTLRKAGANLIMTTEEAVVRVLRTYATRAEGTFPPSLDDLNAFRKAFSKQKAKSALEPEVFELAAAMGRVAAFTHDPKTRFGYKADGVKLGDAGKILFWYQPEGETKYRAVFGDLHVGDVSADQLPEKPKP